MEYNVVYDEDGKSHSSSILEILECQFEDFSVDDKFVDNEKTIPTDEARKKNYQSMRSRDFSVL